MRRRRYYRLVIDGKQGLGKETKFNFKYADEDTLDSLSLGKVIGLNGSKRGIETLAYVGVMTTGLIIIAIVWSLAAILLGNPYLKQCLLDVGAVGRSIYWTSDLHLHGSD